MNADRPHGSDSTAGAGAPAVELIGITKAYPGVVANDDISLAIRAGEVHCLLGENGAGKSTLMSVLSGMTQPDAGRIRVAGRDVRIDSPRSALALGVGMVYQHSTLVPALSVLENLLLGEGTGVRLDKVAGAARLAELAATLAVARRAGGAHRRSLARRAAADRDHQGPVAGLQRPDPRRADLDADAGGRRGAAEGARQAQGGGGRARLHHAQAARGDLDRRPRHDPQAGTRGRRPGRARAGLAHAGAAAGGDRPHHVRRGGGRERSGRRAGGHAA